MLSLALEPAAAQALIRKSVLYPWWRYGTHMLFGSQMDGYRTGEITLAKAVLPRLRKGMLCLADRNFFGFELWRQARGTGADLLWRMKKNMRMACEKRLPDGSYLSRVYPSERDWQHKTHGQILRDHLSHGRLGNWRTSAPRQ